MKLPLLIALLMITLLSACSPSEKAASEKPTFEIAKDERADLVKAKTVAAEAEKAATEATQKIDEQTQ